MSRELKPGWKMVKFGDVVRNANLVERNPQQTGIDRIVGLEHIDPENLHIKRWATIEDGTSFSRKFVPGQTLFGKRRAYQKKVAFAEFPGLCSGDILTFEAKDPKVLLPELLPFICQTDSFFEYALGTSAGSLSPRTSWSALKNFALLLPPLNEQRRMTEILWATDEAINCQLILLQNIRIAQSTFFEEKATSGPHGYLGEAIKKIIAGKSPKGASRPAGEVEHGVLRVSAIGENCFIESENKCLIKSEDFDPELEVKPGFFLVTRANASFSRVGYPCIVKNVRQGLMLSDKTLRLITKEKFVDDRFLYQALKTSLYRKYIETAAGGTEAKNISQEKLKKAPIWLPPIEMQKEVVKALYAFDDSIKLTESCTRRLSLIAKELLNNLGVSNV